MLYRRHRPSLTVLFALLLALAVAPASLAQDQDLKDALSSISAGRYAEATETLTALVEEDIENETERAELHHLLGVTYLRLNDLDKAEYFIQRALSLEPDDAGIRYDLALVHYRTLRYSLAITVLDRSAKLAKSKEMPRIQRLRGLAYARKREWRAAIKNLRPAMKEDPDAGTLVQLGRAYMGAGHEERAVEAFRRAQSLDPTRAESYRLASASLVRIAQDTKSAKKKLEIYGEALQEAENLLTVQPMSWQSWYQAGRAAIGAQEMDKAEDYMRQVVAERPDYCFAWLNLARIYQILERPDEAAKSIADAESCAPELAPTLNLDDFDERDFTQMAWENSSPSR